MITIVNYGSGNINAIGNIYQQLKVPFKVANTPDEIVGSEKIILPGVGAFDETISMLDYSGFRSVLDDEAINKKTPILGICVGMQILANSSEEGSLAGLGWINGKVKKIDKALLNQRPKLPHLGWNSIKIAKQSSVFNDINEVDGFYFLHSYYFECVEEQDVLAQTFYGKTFASAVNHNNIFGVQFHPEKSHHNGVKLLQNFAKI